MIAFVSHHYARQEKLEQVREALHNVGLKMRTYPGFISRVNLEDVDDPTHITAVAYWESEQALDAWDNGPDRGQTSSVDSPWSKPVYRVRFKVSEEFRPE